MTHLVVTAGELVLHVYKSFCIDRLRIYYIKCVCLYAQVHVSPQLIKWKYEYRPTRIRLLSNEIIIVLTLFGLTPRES